MNSDSQAGHLKKEILIRLVKAFLSEDFEKAARLIPYEMRPKGCEVPYRCCVYKERAIIKDRTIAGLGFSIENDDEQTLLSEYAAKALKRKKVEENPLTVLEAACKGCVPSRIFVTDLCQGCVARNCINTCKFGAINIINNKAIIDGAKCKNCKQCINVCPYNAIVKVKVPCEDSCPVDAIAKNESGYARIDFDKCISCGKCVSACPFGAVHEKSQIIDILKNIKAGKKVIAMVAPSIAGQFPGNLYQLHTALLKAGFSKVYEVAQGADITAKTEAKDFKKRMDENEPFMTTSCCAGYNQLVEKHLKEIKPFVSETKTPLFYIAEIAKKEHPDSVTVFISPCVAKRKEGLEEENVDFVMNFEELGAVLIAKKIDIIECEETPFPKESSKQGRNFALTGGVAEAVKKASKDETKICPCHLNGLNKQSIKDLKKMAADKNCPEGNIVEIMCCEGGCIGGNATISSQKTATKLITDFSNKSKDIEKEE